MKKLLFIIAVNILIPGTSFSQITLKIEITGLRNNTGKIMLQFFNEKGDTLRREIGDIRNNACLFTFNGLKAGKYAARFYHDENLNRMMETNLVDKPKEGYGFSNNVTGKFGMPPFEKWLFDLSENKTVTIKAVY